MASRIFDNRLYSLIKGLVMLECNCVIDSGLTGKTRSLKGNGVKAITCVATGIYKVRLDDAYPRYMGGNAGFVSATTGNTAIGAINPTTVYIIRTMGTSTQANWETAGVPSGVVAAPGVPFVCAATSSGTGTCLTQATSGVTSVEVIGDPNLTVISNTDPHFYIATYGATSSGATALIPTAPVDGSVLGMKIFFRNSTVTGKGE